MTDPRHGDTVRAMPAAGIARRQALALLGGTAAGLALGGPLGAEISYPVARPGDIGGRRVVLDGGETHVIAGNRSHTLADTVFEVTAAPGGARLGIEVGAGARIDVLRIRLAPGVTKVRRFLGLGPGVRIGLIDVEAATQTDLPETQLDGFVQVRNDDIDIEAARFLRIDRCMIINRAAGIRIGSFACESYSKGLKIGDSRDVFVGSFSARGRSPNAVPDPGYNGLSIQDSVRVQCPDVLVEDAAEHAIYVSGGHDAAFTRDIRFGRVVTRRSGQCGFKCKAVNLRSVDVSIDSLSVADAAFRSKPGSNEDGLRVENCNGFRVGLLEVFRDTRRHSCHAGIYLDGVRDFSLGQGRIDGAAGPMVMIADRRDGDNERITITGLDGTDLASDGYVLDHRNGRRLAGLDVRGGALRGLGGRPVRIDGLPDMVGAENRITIAAQGMPVARTAGAAPFPGLPGLEVTIIPI